jgi:formylglycine-generating enzyme required for sulfatase activity/tRNA A-37 threonylcarbamoyl transferase component Bud32
VDLRDLTERYRLIEEIGRGSIGVVYRAIDTVLNRAVAVKVLRTELLDHGRHRPRFLREGLIGGRLGHPNIVPVFEVGRIDLPDARGVPCLVMGLLSGRSFRTIIRSGLISIPRQLSWFTQVCHGLAFAHDQGVIHRDIKPAHIFVGDFGQVVLTDWGLAKTRRTGDDEERKTRAEEVEQREVTRIGDIVGTPAYMAPEQAEGRIADLDHRTDIYALGAILYEILTGTRPYEASRSVDVLRALRQGPPELPSQRTPGRDIPAALETVCMRAMARKPSDRFENALDLAAHIEAWFEQAGRQPPPQDQPTQRDERPAPEAPKPPPAESATHLAEGRAEAAAFQRHMQAALHLQTEAHRLEGALRPDAPRAEREEGWRLAERARDRFEQAAWHLAQGVGHLQDALALKATDARRELARLHVDAWRAAEANGEVVAAAFHRARAEANDDGELSAELAGRAALSVHTDGARVGVDLYTIDDRGPVWTTGARVRLGDTPLTGRTVRAARVLVRLTAEDGFNARMPLRMTPGEARLLEVHVPPSHLIPPGFVFVPGGRFLFGADDRAPGVAASKHLEIPSFCIARQPVTWGEYFEFLEDLLAVGADATPHLPRAREGTLVLVSDHRVVWRTPIYAPPNAPIRWISHRDARAYAGWLGRRLGMALRLPTEAEWAYAAGAADGRPYPWGGEFVPGLADTRRKGTEGPAPINSYPDDESPFGMRSVAGGVREWTDSPADDLPDRYLIRGGSWRSPPDQCRIDARATAREDLTHQAIGVRLAADIPGDGG